MNLRYALQTLFRGFRSPPVITTVINYCTNDHRFIHACIREASLFSKEVLVPCSDHFFDGSPENEPLLEQTILENPSARFIRFPWKPEISTESQFWVTRARVLGWLAADPESDYILFLDADEIADGKRMANWLKTYPLHRMNAVKLANYYYFRETVFQAETWEDSAVLIRKNLLREDLIQHFDDRHYPWQQVPEPKERMVTDAKGNPMIHHYSWVRTREEMLKKVRTWGHHAERDWVALVEKEFSGEFSGKDFVHHYTYRKVSPSFDL